MFYELPRLSELSESIGITMNILAIVDRQANLQVSKDSIESWE